MRTVVLFAILFALIAISHDVSGIYVTLQTIASHTAPAAAAAQ
jgi:hypothetical protein